MVSSVVSLSVCLLVSAHISSCVLLIEYRCDTGRELWSWEEVCSLSQCILS